MLDGGSTFNDELQMYNTGSGQLNMGVNLPDTFKADAGFYSGNIDACYAQNSNFHGQIYKSANTTFGNGGGGAILTGNKNQDFTFLIATFNNLTINKSGGDLILGNATPVIVLPVLFIVIP